MQMQAQWQKSKEQVDRRHEQACREILGRHLIRPPVDDEEDRKRATDFLTNPSGMVVLPADQRIAWRVRSYKTYEKYSTDFTIRTSNRGKGKLTELDKILAGCADFYLYCFEGACCESIHYYYVLDMQVFRAWYATECRRTGRKPGTRMPVNDGEMTVFKIRKVGPGFVLAEGYGK